jgi:preprotein translocase subunit SecF
MTDTLSGPAPAPAGEPKGPSLWHRLYHGETTFDFVGRRRIGFAISGLLIVLSLISLAWRGLNYGIDFEGGVAWEVNASAVSEDQVSSILEDNGIAAGDAKIQTLTSASGERLRVQVGTQPTEVQSAVRQDLAEAAGLTLQDVSLNSVSASWGSEITDKAIRALVVFFVVITLYITLRFEWKMAIASLLAVFHDVLISVGVYSLTGWEVTPATVVAFLTILGFSLYDTIVVFDKVHENAKRLGTRATYGDVVNLSMNQVLMRSLNTGLAAILPVLSLLVVGSWMLGATTLEDFALALLVGLIVGAYSSIFVATPILAILKEREPKYRAIRQRLEKSNARASSASRLAAEDRLSLALSADADADAGTDVASRVAETITDGDTVAPSGGVTQAPAKPSAGLTHAPRPRKKKRR